MESLYKVGKIAGKGFGLIALREIKAGTLILKEKPQFVPKDLSQGADYGRLSKSFMNAFFAMCHDDKAEFLELPNRYLDPNSLDDDDREWYFEWKNYAESQTHFDGKLLLKIICIHSTNSLDDEVNSPVGIRFSRINHSCCPNSDCTGPGHNKEGEIEIELRANSKILEGQEISKSFFDHDDFMKNFKERQKEICGMFGIVCSCEICQDEEINNDDETYEQFQNLKMVVDNTDTLSQRKQKLSTEQKIDRLQKAISCKIKMYSLAKSKKAPKNLILNRIIETAFYDAVNGYMLAKLKWAEGERIFLGKMEYFKQEADKLSKPGHQISKMCYGKEHEKSIEWKERNQDFENYFQNSFLPEFKDCWVKRYGGYSR